LPELLLATTNAGKLVEMKALLVHLELQVITPADLGLDLAVAETGGDYAANATLKALAFARASGSWALADDTGLEVTALEGAPGLRSARFAGPDRTDSERRGFLLQCLAGKPRPWLAQFRASVALANPQGEITITEGVCPGEIIPQERGQLGFGYDPVFELNEIGLTMSELSMEDKNRLSHRARAIQAMIPHLRRLLLQE